MQAAQILAGYSLGERRPAAPRDGQEDPVGDGRPARDASSRAARRTTRSRAAKANELFDLIDKFAGYGFNKSHAAAYALLAYQTAWLKAHHRAEFYAASMSFDMALTDKLGDVRRGHAPRRGRVPAARHQRQPRRFHRRETARVRYALGALKGVGEKAMEALVEERERGGPFASLEDFAARIDPRLLNRRQLESLAGAGAFDAIKPDRAAVFAAAETILAHAASAHEQRDQRPGRPVRRPIRPKRRRSACRATRHGRWPSAWRPSATRSASISRRIRSMPRGICSPRTRCKTFAELADVRIAEGERVGATMAGLVEDTRWRTSAKGRRYMMATLSDRSGQFVATAFDDEADARRSKLPRRPGSAGC